MGWGSLPKGTLLRPGAIRASARPAVLVAALDGFYVQAEKLTATESASDRHGEDGVIPLAAERIAVRAGQKPPALLGCEPVPNPDTNPAHSFDPSDPSGELGTEQAGIGGFVRDSSHGSVDRS